MLLKLLVGSVPVIGILVAAAFVVPPDFPFLLRQWTSATISAVIFAAQHTYLLFTIGAVAGVASVVLALAVAFPLALLYEHGGNSLGAPAILHTSSNAPMMLFVPAEAAGVVILPHMAVVLTSMYLSFAFRRWLRSGVIVSG